MANLHPIRNIRREEVLNVIRRALRSGLDADALEDFLASVDWSGTDRNRPEIADLLGQMEGWASQYANSDLTQARYVGLLLSLLPSEEQERHLVLGGGAVVITISGAPVKRRLPVLQGQPAPRPQTGSGAPPALTAGKSESKTVLAA